MERRNIERPFLSGKISLFTQEEALQRIREFLKEDKPRLVVTCDAYAFTVASQDEEFAQILRNADMATPDGIGVVMGGRLLGLPIKERVSGVDLVQKLFPLAERENWSFFFLGGKEGVAEEAARRTRKAFPRLRIVGCQHGYFKPEEEKEVVKKIRESKADILLVGMGIPKQEKFIWRNKDELGVKVAIGVGGTLDVLAGRVKRAPLLMRRLGLEWLYRMLCQPSKIAKVSTFPRYFLLILCELLRKFKA